MTLEPNPERRWWPACIVDEGMPEGRSQPQDWLDPDENGITTVFVDSDKSYVLGRILAGRVTQFCWHEPRGAIEILVMPDGTWSHHRSARCPATPDSFDGAPPARNEPPAGEANLFVWPEDHEVSADNLDAFAHEWASLDVLPGEGVVVVVERHYWSPTVSFTVSADGKSLLPIKEERR